MTQTITQLSNNGIQALTQQNIDSQSVLVQVVEFQPKKNKHYLILSDGFFMIKALPIDQTILQPETDLNAIIAVKRHMMANKVVGILQFEKVFNYKVKIGDPQEFNSDSINPENVEAIKLQQSMIDLKLSPSNQQTTLKQQQTPFQQQATVKKETPQQGDRKPDTQRKFVIPPAQPLNGNLKDYETIKHLYIGMDRWTIVCRIVEVEFREFTSKQGKDTKMLSLELMDRTGMKISGTFFGQAALQFKDNLVKDRVYKISKGQIRQQSYNNSKNDKISPYKLNFTSLSLFEEVSDTSSIAKNEDSAITLGECIDRRIIGQQFDVVCILINIEETLEVKKDNKPLRKTNLLISDPIKGLTTHATVWNDNIIPDRSLIGKTIILLRFKLNEFKSSLTLSSSYKSSIIASESHDYCRYESQALKEYKAYEKLQEIKSTGNQNNEVCTTLRQLEQKIDRLEFDEWARGDFTVYINKFGLKKWHFEGCSHCGKAAESLNSCTHCHKYVQKTVGHFIMPVQLCDSTGSLWTTAYDEWARKIFSVTDQTEVIEYLTKLDANQLKEQTQSYLYQEYRIRINSKKDNEGRIKHHMSKVYERNYAEETFKNIELIRKLEIS